MIKKIRKFLNDNRYVVSFIAIMIILISVLSMVGCVRYLDDAGIEVTRLSDDTAALLDKASEIAPVVQQGLTVASIAFPALAGVFSGIAGIIGASFAAYKRYRPKLTAEHESAVLSGNMTKALVYAIEEFKLTNTEEWDVLKGSLKEKLNKEVGPEALAIIEVLLKAYHNKNN